MFKLTFGTPEEHVPSRYCKNFSYVPREIKFPIETIDFRVNARGCVLSFPLEDDLKIYGFGLQLKQFNHRSRKLKLLLGIFKPETGGLFLQCGAERIPLDRATRRLFAYVPQGNQLMNGSIRDVVTFGDRNAADKDEAIYRALEIACADQFVRELPDGLDTMLGERGAGLSEGQMQRIAVARAIYSDRPVLLLDEATSALDDATEKQLLKNLRAMTDRTVIIVTHRSAVLDVTDTEIRFKKPGVTE